MLPEAPSTILKFGSYSAALVFSTDVAGQVRWATPWLDAEAHRWSTLKLWITADACSTSLTVEAVVTICCSLSRDENFSTELMGSSEMHPVVAVAEIARADEIRRGDCDENFSTKLMGSSEMHPSWPSLRSPGQMKSAVAIVPADSCCRGRCPRWDGGCGRD